LESGLAEGGQVSPKQQRAEADQKMGSEKMSGTTREQADQWWIRLNPDVRRSICEWRHYPHEIGRGPKTARAADGWWALLPDERALYIYREEVL
jgi:hypothetical protein